MRVTPRCLLLLLAAFLPAGAAGGAERRHLGSRPPSDATQPPLSMAVLAGDTLYLSGELGLLPGRKVPATAEEEARILLEKVGATLAEAGMTMDDLVSVQVFCSDVAHFDAWNRVYRAAFSKEYPARAFVGSGPLLFGARFEMQAIAVRRPAAPKALEPAPAAPAGGVVTLAPGAVPHDGLDGVYARFASAYARLDAAGAAGVYTDDVSYLPPDSPVLAGRAEALGSFRAFFESLARDGRRAEIAFEVLARSVSGDLAYDVGLFTLRMPKEGAETRTGRGKYVVVARRGPDGAWRWQVDATSALAAPGKG